MKKLKLLSVLAGFVVAGVVSTQAADKALLNTLVQKGYLTSEEARNLSMTSNHKEGDRGDVFGEQPNTNSIAIGGSVHVRYQYVDPQLKNRGTASDLNSSSSFLVRKAKLGAKASIWDDWRVELVGVYNESSTTVDTALISWDYMEEMSFDFGYGSTPASFENSMSTSELKTMERSIASQYFAGQLGFGDSHVGIFMRGQNVADIEGWRYWLALTRPDNSTSGLSTVTKETTRRNNQPAFFASTGYKFSYEDVHFDTWFNFGYQRNQRNIFRTAPAFTATAVGNETTNDYLASFGLNLMWEDFSLLTEVYGASLDKGKVNSDTSKKRAKPAGITIMPSYMYDDQWEFVFAYSMIRAKDASLNSSTGTHTSGTANGRGVNLTAVSNNFLTQVVPASGATTNSNTGYNDVSAYGFNVNYFPIKGSRQLKVAAGYDFVKARKASTKTGNGAAGTIADTHVDAHMFRADVRLVF